MTLLSRFIFRQFLKHILLLMASFTAIYVLIDFFEKIDNFTEKGKPLSLVWKFFAFNIPFILEQMGPVCILLAGVVTLGILNHSGELVGLKACGIPLARITRPIIAAGVFFSLVYLSLSQFLLPTTLATANRIWNEEVRGRVPLGIYRNGRYYYRGDQGFYSFARPDPRKNEFLHFSYVTWDGRHRLNLLIAAASARWDEGTWTLEDGQIQVPEETGEEYRTTPFARYRVRLPERPSDFFVPEYRHLEMSILQLFEEAKRKRSADERRRAWAEFYGRVSYILLGLPLLLLGLPLLLIVYRHWGRDLSLAIPVSCGLAFFCWGIWGTMQSLAKAGYLPPLPAAFAMHVVMGAAGLYLLYREDR